MFWAHRECGPRAEARSPGWDHTWPPRVLTAGPSDREQPRRGEGGSVVSQEKPRDAEMWPPWPTSGQSPVQQRAGGKLRSELMEGRLVPAGTGGHGASPSTSRRGPTLAGVPAGDRHGEGATAAGQPGTQSTARWRMAPDRGTEAGSAPPGGPKLPFRDCEANGKAAASSDNSHEASRPRNTATTGDLGAPAGKGVTAPHPHAEQAAPAAAAESTLLSLKPAWRRRGWGRRRVGRGSAG